MPRSASASARSYSRKARSVAPVALPPAPPPCEAPAEVLSAPVPANDAAPAPVAAEAPAGRTWSVFQTAIFADASEGSGDTVVQARAGTGKTTTILEMLRHIPASVRVLPGYKPGDEPRPGVLLCAFNGSIKDEIASRVERDGIRGVEVSTIHSFGFGALRYAFKGIQLDKGGRKVGTIIVSLVGDHPDRNEYRSALKKLVSLAKGMLAETEEQITEIANSFPELAPWTIEPAFARDAVTVLARCKADTRVCDFDDMVWMPVVHRLRTRQFPRVIVDETQDLNRAQIELVKMARARGGRICAVGDDRQAIYGFRGADSRAMAGLIETLSAKVLPLSVTYRCARSIVALAAEIVPDYQAASNAPEGEVSPASPEQLKDEARPGDFVLSRTNAPIVGLCLAFLMRGIPATVAGRDIGEGLIALIEKSKARTLPALATWIDEWADAEINRRRARNREVETQDIEDRAECVHKLSEGARSVDEVIAKIRSLFSDSDDKARIVLSTVHKAKGLERDRAWLLRDTFRPTRSVEEANLYYVAVTRARSTLRLVSKVK